MLNSRRTKGVALGQIDSKASNSTTNKTQQIHHDPQNPLVRQKRQGDDMLDPNQKRRAAFGDITNGLNEIVIQQKKGEQKKKIPTKVVAVTTKATTKPKKSEKKKKSEKNLEPPVDENVIRLSQESYPSSSQESLSDKESISELNTTFTVESEESQDKAVVETVPESVDDVDSESIADTAQCALYAPFIFRYYKERELKFMVPMYMDNQPALTSNMRAILVDWLVEVQENFELNHETLYLAVKLVDTYLAVKKVSKENLQLVGAAALFVACKFDERCPPLVEDFLYICDDAYNRREFLEMERQLLKTVGFDIGMPLSYRFLRRYAKANVGDLEITQQVGIDFHIYPPGCARAVMETLTLARYILEMSLMEYELIKYRESKIASACLLLAFKMKKNGEWNKTMEYYTGYSSADLLPLVKELNTLITSPPRQLTTIRSKYSHKVFYEVAKTPVLKEEEVTSS